MGKGKMNLSKFGGPHTTVTDAAVGLIKMLQKNPFVTKISPRIRKQKGRASGQISYKTFKIVGGIKLTVNGSATVQEFYIYCSDTKKIEEAIAEFWNSKKGKRK